MDTRTYNELQRCIEFVRSQLKEASPYCSYANTISKSNAIFSKALEQAKTKCFRSLAVDIREQVMAELKSYYTY